MSKVVIFFISIFGFVGLALSQERFVMPVDDAKKNESFLAFRTKLIAAAERKDSAYILRILDPQIKLSFGDDSGIAAFKRMWKPTDKKSEFWAEFLPVIKNGGGFSKESKTKLFVAPYTFSDWPDDIDGFEHMVIFGNNVNLREGPSTDSRVVERLSYNVVKVDSDASIPVDRASRGPGGNLYTWYKVTTLGGKTGFVASEYVRSHVDFRAGFELKRGGWKMTFFIAGD